jgi:signal transduction histidine kinase
MYLQAINPTTLDAVTRSEAPKNWTSSLIIALRACCGLTLAIVIAIAMSAYSSTKRFKELTRQATTIEPREPTFLIQLAQRSNEASLWSIYVALVCSVLTLVVGAWSLIVVTRDVAGEHRAEEIVHTNTAEDMVSNADLRRENEARKMAQEAHERAAEGARELNVELEERVSQRTAQLEAANKELEAFSYSVSHDLRSPLRAINGFSRALQVEARTDLSETAQDYLNRIVKATQRMSQLIDDLLNLAKVSRSQFLRERVNLTELVQSVVAEVQEQDPQRLVDIVVAPNIVADGDPKLLRVALQNLLDNAWKFTGKKPQARIEFGTCAEHGPDTYFVRDNGAGFDPTFSENLFGVFQRLHSMEEFPGTGIGLATVQRIIHRHGGRIWADAAPNHGATFYFSL